MGGLGRIEIARSVVPEDYHHAVITIFEVGRFETHFKRQGPLSVVSGSGADVLGTFPVSDLDHGVIYEIVTIEFRSQSETETPDEHVLGVLKTGDHFSSLFFAVTEGHGDGNNPRDPADIATDILEERERVLAHPLGDAFQRDAEQYEVFCFVRNLLLTRQMRLRGVEVYPIVRGDSETSILSVVNEVLGLFGNNAPIRESEWAPILEQRHPLALIRFPRVYATTYEEAGAVVDSYQDLLIDLFAVHRGASGEAVANIIVRLRDGGKAWRPAAAPYRGNLIGGWLSGEDPTSIIHQVRAIEGDSLLQLWLALFREARAESNPDHQFARYWHVLEAIAQRAVRSGLQIYNLDGDVVRARGSGRPYKTHKQPAGDAAAVYALLRRAVWNYGDETQHASRHHGWTTWDLISIWGGLRNATLHYGGFRLGDPVQASARWYQTVADARQKLDELNESEKPFGDPLLRWLREALEGVLRAEMAAAISAADDESRLSTPES